MKEDRQGYKILGVLTIIIGVLALVVGICIKESEKTYEYAINGVIKESKECYQRDDGVCFCKEGNNFIQVDNYYEKEN